MQRAGASPVGLPSVDPAVKAHHDTVVIARFAEAVNTARWLEAVAAIERAQQAEALARVRAPRPASQSSSGGGNVLPADYTFTAADRGSHAFLITLASTGTQTVNVADTVLGALKGSFSISVKAAATGGGTGGGGKKV